MKTAFQKNQELELYIEDFTKDGEGLGKYQGFPFFVKDTVIGDRVKVRVTRCRKNYGYARLTEILAPSPDRVSPPCPVARQCGGCRLQQVRYPAQLAFKQRLVENCLRRIGGFADIGEKMEPIVGMEDPWHYRNKAQFPVGTDREGNPVAGFYAGRTHVIVPNTDCLIQAEPNKAILEIILSYMKEYHVPSYDEQKHKGLVRHILTRIGFATGQIMVCLVANGTAADFPSLSVLTSRLRSVRGMTSILVNTNTDQTNRILGKDCQTVWGADAIEDRIGPVRYRIGPMSFYQVNPGQTRVLYEKALEYADLSGGEDVWDLYCGIGTISLFLARKAGRVRGVEIVPEAVEDARKNARLNGIGNARFFVGKAEAVVPAVYAKTGTHPDVIVVDPPRKGCDGALLQTMLSMAPQKIVYVSCDPATLARDLKILCAGHYRLEKVAPVDQFGHSCHVECVVLLARV